MEQSYPTSIYQRKGPPMPSLRKLASQFSPNASDQVNPYLPPPNLCQYPAHYMDHRHPSFRYYPYFTPWRYPHYHHQCYQQQQNYRQNRYGGIREKQQQQHRYVQEQYESHHNHQQLPQHNPQQIHHPLPQYTLEKLHFRNTETGKKRYETQNGGQQFGEYGVIRHLDQAGVNQYIENTDKNDNYQRHVNYGSDNCKIGEVQLLGDTDEQVHDDGNGHSDIRDNGDIPNPDQIWHCQKVHLLNYSTCIYTCKGLPVCQGGDWRDGGHDLEAIPISDDTSNTIHISDYINSLDTYLLSKRNKQ